MFYILYAFGWLITLLPLRVLYLISDFFYLVVYYIVRYRKPVVRENIFNSLPAKTEKERRKIERGFYRFFCDLFVETMKEIHMGKEEIRRRMTYGNVDEIIAQYAKGKSVMLMTAHYGNWEWLLNLPESFPAENKVYQIYKQLRNEKFDKLIYSLRSKYGGNNIEKRELLRSMYNLKNEGKNSIFIMVSDQTPNGRKIHLWTPFLNQDTPTVTGTEQLARKFDYPVFYADIYRVRRGYYHCEFIPISLEPKATAEFEITETYMKLLEQTIHRNPEYWLWSHRRWKFKRDNAESASPVK